MDGRTDICSSATAPALLYYYPSMSICNICISTIRGGRISQKPWKDNSSRVIFIHHIHVDNSGATMPTDATRL
jgi:hypothetical protein